jgi:hypothetical protein
VRVEAPPLLVRAPQGWAGALLEWVTTVAQHQWWWGKVEALLQLVRAPQGWALVRAAAGCQ